MEERDLPVGWAMATVGELTNVGPKNETADETEVGFVPLQRLGVTYLSRHTHEPRVWKEVKKGYTQFQNGDVLLARITPSFENGKAGIARDLPNGLGAGSTEYIVFRPFADALDPRYLLAHFKTRSFLTSGEMVMTGAVGQQRVPKAFVLESQLPLAPLNEQRRIAAKLDTTLAAVEACRQRLDGVAAILKRFRQAVLAAATSGELTREWREERPDSIDAAGLARYLRTNHQNSGGHRAGNAAPPTEGVHDLSNQDFPDGWQLVCLRDIVKPERPITYGILKPGPELSNGIPYVRVADYPGNKLSLDGIRKTSQEIDELYKRSRLELGDLLISIRGTVGRLISIPAELIGANITQDSARLSIQEVVDSSYIMIALQSEILQSRMRRAIKGVAVRGINIGDVRALQIPLPSIEEQEEVSRRVNDLISLSDQLEAKLSAARKIVDRLTSALLAKAFRGELVVQDPSDEPAWELLERIRASRQADAAAGKPSRRGRHKPLAHSELSSLAPTPVPTDEPSRVFLVRTGDETTQGEKSPSRVSKPKPTDNLKGWSPMQKDLIQILEQHQTWISASTACEEMGISDGSSSDDLELFYSQLKEQVEDGLVDVQRRVDEDWLKLSSLKVA
ncbi:restriction endonuclease subunit S [Cyanobium gracile]|uniref:Restriction endonuclease S subunit n=1 Tax=Cyanobium gracile (strain ATCC 27147 / PCC 6307) TaxID=292564 RepID=K9P6A0_CYAGP|nr:restriction endonuclease subunit S [Cyanobium gracile]AFY28907.1 restriction endonuclease S subunit [Cyanobium gracile PCC 6307]